ncbi:MAG: hypothetical protein MUE32_03855 [Bacteroidales bacterium]|nr:hypothetical protein [Bacteroidales bacterium]
MKILILTHSYPDARLRWRGIFVKEQALALAENNDVTVVYFRVDYSSFAPFGKYGFERRDSVAYRHPFGTH